MGQEQLCRFLAVGVLVEEGGFNVEGENTSTDIETELDTRVCRF